MHVLGVVAFAQEMIVVRIELHLELLVRLHQRVKILHRVLHMHIVIARSVTNKHLAAHVLHMVHQRSLFISARINLRTTHIALRISAVV